MSVAFIGCWLFMDGISVVQTDLLQCFINSVEYDTKWAAQQGKIITNKQTVTLSRPIDFVLKAWLGDKGPTSPK